MSQKVTMQEAVEALGTAMSDVLAVAFMALHRQTGLSLEALQQALLDLQPSSRDPLAAAMAAKMAKAIAGSLLLSKPQDSGRA
jgi:hypothetical protein